MSFENISTRWNCSIISNYNNHSLGFEHFHNEKEHFPILNENKKKKEMLSGFCCFYVRFLSSNMPTMAMAMIMAIVAMVVFIIFAVLTASRVRGVAVGTGVAAAETTAV